VGLYRTSIPYLAEKSIVVSKKISRKKFELPLVVLSMYVILVSRRENNMKVFIYWNLRKKCWSVKNVKSGKVVQHAKHLCLCNVAFKVSEAGRQRVLRNKRKNVHAGVVGEIIDFIPVDSTRCGTVSYNPYKGPNFICVENGLPMYCASYVEMNMDRRVTWYT
jgi:hypothetical protein